MLLRMIMKLLMFSSDDTNCLTFSCGICAIASRIIDSWNSSCSLTASLPFSVRLILTILLSFSSRSLLT